MVSSEQDKWCRGLAGKSVGKFNLVDFIGANVLTMAGCQPVYKFADLESDSETSADLDDASFRYYDHRFARWMSPDPAGLAAVDPDNPQSWNQYEYSTDSPSVYVDPDGTSDTDEVLYGWGSHSGSGSLLNYFLGSIGRALGGDPSLSPGDWAQKGEERYETCVVSGIDCYPNNGFRNGVLFQTIWIGCTGSLSDLICRPPSQAALGSLPFVGSLATTDVPVGMDIWNCQGCPAIWRNASGAANTALVATGAVLAGVPLAGEAGASSAGDFLFARGTGLLNSNDYVRIGWAWARTSVLDYPYGGLTYFGIRILNWHLNDAIWSYPTH